MCAECVWAAIPLERATFSELGGEHEKTSRATCEAMAPAVIFGSAAPCATHSADHTVDDSPPTRFAMLDTETTQSAQQLQYPLPQHHSCLDQQQLQQQHTKQQRTNGSAAAVDSAHSDGSDAVAAPASPAAHQCRHSESLAPFADSAVV